MRIIPHLHSNWTNQSHRIFGEKMKIKNIFTSEIWQICSFCSNLDAAFSIGKHLVSSVPLWTRRFKSSSLFRSSNYGHIIAWEIRSIWFILYKRVTKFVSKYKASRIDEFCCKFCVSYGSPVGNLWGINRSKENFTEF